MREKTARAIPAACKAGNRETNTRGGGRGMGGEKNGKQERAAATPRRKTCHKLARHAAESYEPCTTRAAMRSRAEVSVRPPDGRPRVDQQHKSLVAASESLPYMPGTRRAPGSEKNRPQPSPSRGDSAGKYRSHHARNPREDHTK